MKTNQKMGMERMTKNAFVGVSNAQKVRLALMGSELTITEIALFTNLSERKVRNVVRNDFNRGILLNAGRLGRNVLYTVNTDKVCMVTQILKTKNVRMPKKRGYTKDCAGKIRTALGSGPMTVEQITKSVKCDRSTTYQNVKKLTFEQQVIDLGQLPHHGMRGKGKKLYALSDGNGGVKISKENMAAMMGIAHA